MQHRDVMDSGFISVNRNQNEPLGRPGEDSHDQLFSLWAVEDVRTNIIGPKPPFSQIHFLPSSPRSQQGAFSASAAVCAVKHWDTARYFNGWSG